LSDLVRVRCVLINQRNARSSLALETLEVVGSRASQWKQHWWVIDQPSR
jgi:hypothetical protein